MKPSPACINLLKHLEGCKLTAYPDSCGIATVGYGHTASSLHLGDTITQAQAESLLYHDADFIGKCVFALAGPIPQCQFDALVVLAFNIGPTALRTSTLLRKLLAGDVGGAAEEFSKWNHAGGKVLPGLTQRREVERQVFLGLTPA